MCSYVPTIARWVTRVTPHATRHVQTASEIATGDLPGLPVRRGLWKWSAGPRSWRFGTDPLSPLGAGDRAQLAYRRHALGTAARAPPLEALHCGISASLQ